MYITYSFNASYFKNMKQLYAIISCLSKQEKKLVSKFIQSTSSSSEKLKLFNTISKNNCLNFHPLPSETSNRLKSKEALTKRKQRLLNDIENVILFSYNIDEKADCSYNKNKKNVIVSLLLANFYMERNLYNEALAKLKKSFLLIRKYDYIFLESIYNEIYCEFLKQTKDEGLEKSLINAMQVHAELRYIYSLSLDDIKSKFQNNQQNIQNNILQEEIKTYTSIYEKYIHLKHLVNQNKIKESQRVASTLSSELSKNIDQIPGSLIAEIKIQYVRLNILSGQLTDNIRLFNDIFQFNQLNLDVSQEAQQLLYINSFLSDNLDYCKTLTFRILVETKTQSSINNLQLINIWKYFEICTSFKEKAYKRALRQIAQIPSRTNISETIQINLRIIELYLLLILGEADMFDYKLTSLKLFFKRIKLTNDSHYAQLIIKIEQTKKELCAGKFVSDYSTYQDTSPIPVSIPDNILNYELISWSLVEKRLCQSFSTSEIF